LAEYRWLLVVAWVGLLFACGGEQSAHSVPDKTLGAQRIITLSPHLTEQVYSAGAGNRLVGVVAYSDFPEAAKALPLVGDAFRLDYEVLVALEPDLVLAWDTGTPVEVIERLQSLDLRVVTVETSSLVSIADNLRLIGELAGSSEQAEAAAEKYLEALAELGAPADAAPVRVFYQVASQPLFTVSGNHVISESIELCGGKNIFAELDELSPAVSTEAVVERKPDAIIAGHFTADEVIAREALSAWRLWGSMPAVANDHLYLVNANKLHRSSVRIVEGVAELCQRIGAARNH